MKNENNSTVTQQNDGAHETEKPLKSTTKNTTHLVNGRKPRHNVTVDELKRTIRYDPDTGLFWRISINESNRRYLNKVAGCLYKGYNRICIGGSPYLGHRLAWLYMTGEFPMSEIDHINRDGTDNRWCNLRLATSAQQKMNTTKYRNTRSGLKGVCWFKRDKKWRAYARTNNKQKHLGYFDKKEDAYEAYRTYCLNLYGEYANV